jgi:hypothetical protein
MDNIDTGTAIVKADVGNLIVDDPVLAKYATEIRRLVKRAKEDIVEIGRYLHQAQEHAGHGTWLIWIEAEFGWSDQTARRFIHVYEFTRDSKFNNLLNSDLPLSALYQLAAPNTPIEARQQVAERIESGETLSCATVTEVIAEAKNGGAAEDAGGDDVEDPGTAQHRAAMAQIADAEDAPTTAGQADEQQILRDLILEEFFAQASGADIYDRIPADRLDAVCRDFLDKLGVKGMRTRMSDEFGTDLRSQKFAPAERKKSAKKWKRSINLTANSARQERGHRSRH